MKIDGGLDKRQLKELRQALAAAELKPKQRQRLLWRIAKLGIINAARRHQRNQVTPDGQPWPKRKRGKGKMLRQLPRLLHVREMPEREAVRIYLKGGNYRNNSGPVSAGLIGAVHQEGTAIPMSAEKMPRPDQRGKPALMSQAKRLRALGYRVWKKGRYVKASSRQIMESMSMAQAGLLIKKLRGKPTKSTWTIDIPARVFLGVSDTEFNKILARQLQAIGFGWNVNAQDIKGKQ
ncbi:phage virion morphogenesis protein [Klebsiella michiganensis]|uniref:phage virion morphogenesis protein n=1 Tax=Klebsiella michiganensis TaxID=1134687 RepID=UPI0023AB18A4|nr:phage virion morphogenesis protein [Klebsiella michiganensis]WEF08790.1 phage virion morphogenesis protein [Klebsiella michiganensis]